MVRMPRFVKTLAKNNNEAGLVRFHIVRVSFFESVGVFGIMLAIMGAGWEVTLPFFIVSFIALIWSFPTEANWKKLADKVKDPETPT
jgi:hypothetical protein